MSEQIVTHTTLEGYFAELVREALDAERVDLNDDSSAYLISLVADFGQRDALHAGGRDGEGGTPALFRLYERAVTAPPREAVHAYRRLGDVALMVSGFFTPHIERSLVSVDYYRDMGGSAYQHASSLDRSGVFAPLLSQLAAKFSKLIEVLSRVAERTTLPIARDIAALYERWARNPDSKDLSARLVGQGAMPMLIKGAA